MEDQRAFEAWYENEVRSGRDPSKICGCPMGSNKAIPFYLNISEFQPTYKKALSDVIVDITAGYFGIEGAEKKGNLKILFDAYSDLKVKEKITAAFSAGNKNEEKNNYHS